MSATAMLRRAFWRNNTWNTPPAFPAGFSLCYDRHAIQADGRYVVEARVFVDGELRLASREPRRVLDGSSATVEISAEPVAR